MQSDRRVIKTHSEKLPSLCFSLIGMIDCDVMPKRRTKIREAKTAEQYREAISDRWHKIWDKPVPRAPAAAPEPARKVRQPLRERPTFDFDDED
jgi:hypothetical protein